MIAAFVLIATILAVITLVSVGPFDVLGGLVEAILTLRIRLLHGSRIVVIDGDTIRFRKNRLFGLLGYDFIKGRLRGIDAPESNQAQGSAATHTLRRMLIQGGWHIAISCKKDVYERELMWLVNLKGPVGLRMIWKGYAFSTTLIGAPLCFLSRILRRGMWKNDRVIDPQEWRARNHHGYQRY